MPELTEIIASLKEYVGDDAEKAKEAAEAIHKDAQSLAQVLIDKGAGKGKSEVRKQLTKAEADLAAAQEQVETLTGELEQARNKSPEEVQKLQRKVEALSEKLTAKEAEFKAERDGRRGDTKESVLDRLIKKFKPGVDVDEDYATTVLRAKLADRINVMEDRSTEIKRLGSDAVYAPAEGQDALDLLYADALKTVPAKFRLTGVEDGGGRGGGGGGGTMDEYDKIRADAKKDRETPVAPVIGADKGYRERLNIPEPTGGR